MTNIASVDQAALLVAGRAAARLSKVVEVSLDGVGLSLPQYRLLLLLADGTAVATALAERLTVSRPSITALVNGLVERGFVERVADTDDRRRVTHSLTADGRAALARGDEAIQSRLQTDVGLLPAGQQKAAIDGLALWLDALDRARRARVEDADAETAPS